MIAPYVLINWIFNKIDFEYKNSLFEMCNLHEKKKKFGEC